MVVERKEENRRKRKEKKKREVVDNVAGFGIMAKLPANTQLAGMSLDTISSLMPLQFVTTTSYGPVFVGNNKTK